MKQSPSTGAIFTVKEAVLAISCDLFEDIVSPEGSKATRFTATMRIARMMTALKIGCRKICIVVGIPPCATLLAGFNENYKSIRLL
ncbi:MAG: hypothetical protein K0R75_2550 [Paenibacillaceae bacterium]|nr:hypothetical protein [Paenibacillaceae bacterium]